MAKGAAKRGLMWVSLVIAIMIGLHYNMTMNRMAEVKIAFEKDVGAAIGRHMVRKVAPYVMVKKSREWRLEGDNFVSPNYERPFFSARCIVK